MSGGSPERQQLRQKGDCYKRESGFVQHVEAKPEPEGGARSARIIYGNFQSLAHRASVAKHLPAQRSPNDKHHRSDEASDKANRIKPSRSPAKTRQHVSNDHA